MGVGGGVRKMMIVYAVYYCSIGEFPDLQGLFSTREKAEEYIKGESGFHQAYLHIVETTVK